MNNDIKLIKAVLFSLLVLPGCEESEPKPEPQADTPSITSFSPEEGAIGTQVTISGANFSAVPGENSVQFNGKTAEVDAATATQLTTSVPAGAETGKITVAVNGMTASSAKDFLVKTKSSSSWVQKANLPVDERTYAASFSVGGKGYFVTGLQSGPQGPIAPVDLWAYDPSSNTWTQKADFEGLARLEAVGFAIGNKGYVGTGQTGHISGYLEDFWEYDPATNDWTKKKDFEGPARAEAVGFSIGNRGYIATGEWEKSYMYHLRDLWEYDPEKDNWGKLKYLPDADLILATGFSIGNKGYVGTGITTGDDDKNHPTMKFWEYDPAKDTWTQKKDFGGGIRSGAVGFSIGNKGYIGTGAGNGEKHNDLWEYDPTKDTWTKKNNFNGAARTAAFGFSIGNKGYIGGGYGGISGIPLNDFWEYTP